MHPGETSFANWKKNPGGKKHKSRHSFLRISIRKPKITLTEAFVNQGTTVVSKSHKVLAYLYSSVARSHKYCVQFWTPHFKKDADKWEQVQRRVTRMMIRGLETKPCEERLKELGMFSLETRKQRGDRRALIKYLKSCLITPTPPPMDHPLRADHFRLFGFFLEGYLPVSYTHLTLPTKA